MRLLLAIILMIILSGLIIIRIDQVDVKPKIRANFADFRLVENASRTFAIAPKTQPITFPDNLGSHPDYQTEGWYYAGHLTDDLGKHYGFQLTFFRLGLTRGMLKRVSEWASNQIYFVDFAITDVADKKFITDERFSRGNNRLAGATSVPYRVWVEDWYVQEITSTKIQIKAQNADIAVDLRVEQVKPAALSGEQNRLGREGKGLDYANAYYILTDTKAEGEITTPRGTFAVTGNVWQTHQWGTYSNLELRATGWDWFLLQLNDGREIVYFRLRDVDGPIKAVSNKVLLVNVDGTTRYLSQEGLNITVDDQWTSPETGATYPSKWTFAIPSQKIELHIKPLLTQQEFRGYSTYWKGIVSIDGTQQGYGYIEMAGYYEDLIGLSSDSIVNLSTQ